MAADASPGTSARAGGETRLGAALRVHAQALRRQPLFLRARHLREVGAAWDAALADPQTGQKLRERALLLRADAALAEAALRGQIAADLAALARAAREPLDEEQLSAAAAPSPVLLAAARRLGDELLAEMETRCAALRARAEAQRPLPIREEWREWDALRDRHAEVTRLAGGRLRRLLWPTLHFAACGFAVWLWNERDERGLAHAIFGHLLREAEALGDEQRAELQRKNLACGG